MTEDDLADSHRTPRPAPLSAGPLLARLALAAALLAAHAAAPSPASAQSLRYTRPLDVPEAGWVRVPLGPETIRRTSAGGGFRLYGPEGEEVPFRRTAGQPGSLRRGVEPGTPTAAEAGWWIPLEAAPGPRLHERLLVELDAPVAGDGTGPRSGPGEVRLEGSADGETWRLLVAGDLVPVPGAADRHALSYPATDLDRLRLFWPRGNGSGSNATPPRIARAAVVEVPPGSSRLSLARPECRAGEPSEAPPGAVRTVCRLPLGGAGNHLRHLCFLVTSEGPAGYRLLDAEEGRWKTVAEGVWGLPGDDVPRCLRLDLRLADGTSEPEALRLELHGAGGEAATVREASAELAPEELVFRARDAGVHTLAYGPAVLAGGEGGDAPSRRALPPPSDALRVEPGPEEATEVPVPAPSLFAAAGAPPPAVTWRETWSVTAEAPEPGRLFRLTLPEVVYGVARPGLPDLRLLRAAERDGAGGGGGDPIPFVRWRPRTPELAAERRGVALRGGESRRAEVEPGVPGLPLSALVATALPRGEGFSRRVRVRYLRAAEPLAPGAREVGSRGDAEGALVPGQAPGQAPDDGADEAVGPWREWVCRARPPLPCRVTLALDEIPARLVTLEIDDPEEGPLPPVDLELWRRRDVLLFTWPAAGSEAAAAVLAAGADDVESPDPPELTADGGLAGLLARPWRAAALSVEGAGADGSGRPGKWAIGLALVAALFALLLLLHRILGEQADRRSGP